MTLDIQEGLDETSNPGYLEASTMHHKTQHVKSKQGIPLHLVAPVRDSTVLLGDLSSSNSALSTAGVLFQATLRASFPESLMQESGRVTASRPARRVHGLTSFLSAHLEGPLSRGLPATG